MKTTIKYELILKTTGNPWCKFDEYKDKEDPNIDKYAKAFKRMKFNEGVKIVTVTTTREEVYL